MRLVKKRTWCKGNSCWFLISVFNCLFKSVYIFTLSLREKKLQLFQYWQFFVFASIFFALIVVALNKDGPGQWSGHLQAAQPRTCGP